MRSGRGTVIHPPSKKEGLRMSMSTVLDTTESNLGNQQCLRFQIWFTMTFYLQNLTDIITKCNSYFITKCVRCFIKKYDSFITKCDSYYKISQFYYKMWQLLQNATFIANCVGTLFLKLSQCSLKNICVGISFW